MKFRRRLPLVLLAVLGCRMDNPGFEGDDAADTDKDTGKDTGSETGESESPGTETAADSTSTNDGSSSSSEGSTSEGSTSDTSTSSDTSTDANMTDGLDAPDLSCPMIDPATNCMECMQNQCCIGLDLDCFDNSDPLCFCVLNCLSEGGPECDLSCGADPMDPALVHAHLIYDCGLDLCGGSCGG